MSVHPRVGVLAGRNRHRRVAQRAARRDSVRFRGIKLGALVFCRTEVVVAKGSSTEVAADREEVVLVAGRVGTRAAHKEHLGVGAVFAGRHCWRERHRGRESEQGCVTQHGYSACLYTGLYASRVGCGRA